MGNPESNVRIPEPLADFIAGELARAIELGEYKPGERLVEAAIAARYGVSRAPVREALRMLAKHELVMQRPRRGTVVTDLSPAEISEMFELRSALYAAIVRRFVRWASPADLDALAALFQRINDLAGEPSVTPTQFVDATQASSVFLVAHCGNRRLQDTFRRLTSQSYRYYAEMAHSTIASRRRLVAFAAQMLQAARAGDAEAASTYAWRLHESNHAAALAAIAAKADQASA
jgi:DNA-binding GntR family transcriptional regulator